MSAGMWGATLFLIAAGSLLTIVWVMSKPEREDPPGVTIHRDARFGWNYSLDDRRGMWSIGYLTRASAIRAAKAELNRFQERDNA